MASNVGINPRVISFYSNENTVASRKKNSSTALGKIFYLARTIRDIVLRIWEAPLRILGSFFRDKLYLPLNNPTTNKSEQSRQRVASVFFKTLKNGPSDPSDCGETEKLKSVRHHFSTYDMHAHIKSDITRIFKLRIFESKEPINGKKLKLVLFSFNGNKQVVDNIEKNWSPSSIGKLGDAAFNVLRALKNNGEQVDSMITKSLGSVILDNLKKISSKEQDLLPKTLVLNRAFTSSRKVGSKLYSRPISFLLRVAARLSKWIADPERELLSFLKRHPTTSSMDKRKVVILEAEKDTYFSGIGGFHPNFHKQLEESGVDTFRGTFYPAEFHDRAHHAVPLDLLSNNVASTIHDDHAVMPIGHNETVADAVTKQIFLNNNNDHHTCFFVGGNIETLDLQTRTVYPLLASFVSNAKKETASGMLSVA